jgi:hypothetical protein
MRAGLIKPLSESVMADVCLGVAVTSLYTLVRPGDCSCVHVTGGGRSDMLLS